MAESDDVFRPFTTFNFAIEIHAPGLDGVSEPLCKGAFSECDGLEMTMEVKTIREGGNNARQIRLNGPVSFGQLTLKRGMTESFDLWLWFREAQKNPWLRADADVIMLRSSLEVPSGAKGSPADAVTQARFTLSRCVPVKIKAPGLNAKDGLVAIEEMQIAYETMELTYPKLPGAKTGNG